ncbi:MAG: hypothetical protein AB7O96_06705 [Pseudobdellovibrionaceae bacterium]
MRSLSRMALVDCIIFFVTLSAFGSTLKCAGVFFLGPKGKLVALKRPVDGGTGGKWASDENGINWFVKRDLTYSELQTSAEPIAAQVYQHFGYHTPETVKFIKNKIHYSASKDIGQNHSATNFSEINTSEIRQMRVVAAYLKDWDRLGNPLNNKKMPDGSLTILDFGGALGSRSMGEHKPGQVVSDAIGCFEATSNIDTIYSSFTIKASSDHPWMKINRSDAEAVIQKFRFLSDEKIESIVRSAQYSKVADHNFMAHALKLRRDGIVSHLLSLFPENPIGHLTPDSTASEIIQKFIGPEGEPSPYELYGKIFDEKVVSGLRASSTVRFNNAAKLKVDVSKFQKLTDKQLEEQWQGPELNLPTSATQSYWGPTKNLKRGDFVRVTRLLAISREDLVEFLKTKTIASRYLHTLNYDLSKSHELLKAIGLRSIKDLLDEHVGSGGVAISTTYVSSSWGTALQNGQHLVLKSATDNNPFFGTKEFLLTLEFNIPVEAIILPKPGYELPEHVNENPIGFGVVGKSKEREITFVDLIPSDWLATDISQLKKEYEDFQDP